MSFHSRSIAYRGLYTVSDEQRSSARLSIGQCYLIDFSMDVVRIVHVHIRTNWRQEKCRHVPFSSKVLVDRRNVPMLIPMSERMPKFVTSFFRDFVRKALKWVRSSLRSSNDILFSLRRSVRKNMFFSVHNSKRQVNVIEERNVIWPIDANVKKRIHRRRKPSPPSAIELVIPRPFFSLYRFVVEWNKRRRYRAVSCQHLFHSVKVQSKTMPIVRRWFDLDFFPSRNQTRNASSGVETKTEFSLLIFRRVSQRCFFPLTIGNTKNTIPANDIFFIFDFFDEKRVLY